MLNSRKNHNFGYEVQQIEVVFLLGLSIFGLILLLIYLQYSKRRVLESTMALLQQEWDMFMQGPVMTFTWKNMENWPVKQVSENVLDVLGYAAEEFLSGSVV